MLTYVYDIECLQNLFTVTFVNVDDESDIKVFHIGLGNYDCSDLKKFLHTRMVLVGYNNHFYDDPMLRFILSYSGEKINKELYNLSGMLVNDGFRGDKTILGLRYPRNKYYTWNSIDLMRMLGLDMIGVSLKQISMNLKWSKVQDMPIEHDQIARDEDLEMVLGYNLNDVLITLELYKVSQPTRDLRRELSKLYHVNLTSASNSKMANLIFEHIYSEELKLNISSIKDKRTRREKVLLGECLAEFVDFKTPELNEVLDRVSSTYVYREKRYKYKEDVYYAGCRFALGVGGLHSVDEPGIFETDDEYIIRDMDVSSYYPNLIINNNFYPKHLGENFIRVLKRITKERIEAKNSGDDTKAFGLKITINSVFGKLGSETFWLLDPKQMLSTTVSGQMGLLMLIEDLHINGIQVISCNTDGVVCKIPREKEELYFEIAKRWEEKTSLELDYTTYNKYIRRDVNSYITEKDDGETKEKGAFLTKIDLNKGYKAYRMPIVAKAMHAYFIDGVPVRETLENCRDIMEFCTSQKSGDSFIMELTTIEGVEILQKTNRYYISNTGGTFTKRDKYTGRVTNLQSGKLVRILNDYNKELPFEYYDVNILYYEKEVMKIVDEIEPKQISMFDLSKIGGTITKAPLSKDMSEQKEQARKTTVRELNKLGKNQLLKRLESMAMNEERINRISPRYAYVLEFSSKDMSVNLYSLGRGVSQLVKLDKKQYNKNPINTGQLLFCSAFQKKNRAYWLAEYEIVSKFEEDKIKLMD